MMPKNQRAARSPRSRASSSRAPLLLNPPSIVTNLRGRTRLRYACTVASGTPVVVTRACLLSVLCTQSSGASTPATVTYFPIIGAARIRKVTVWQETEAPSSTAYGDALSLEYLSDLGRPLKVTRSVISTISSPLSLTPPKNSRADMWSSTSPTTASKNEILFQLTVEGPSGVTPQSTNFILDLDFEYVTGNDYSSFITFTTTFHAGIGNAVTGLFALPLDILNAAGTQAGLVLKPVGILTGLVASDGNAITVTAVARTN